MRNDPRSHGLWEETAAPAPETRPLAQDMAVDVAVVGGGYTGLSAALHLCEGGAKVAVLEAVEIGFGGSGRNVGLVNAGMWVMPDEVPKTLGPEYGDRLLELLGNAPGVVFALIEKHRIRCEAVRTGTLHVAVGSKGFEELEARAAQWQARNAPVQLLDASETAAKVGSTAYSGSLLDPRAGTIQPLGYARGLAGAAIAAGASVHTDSPVQDVARSGSKWAVRARGATVLADWIVVATNAYAGTPWQQIRSELVALPYFNFATVPLSEGARQSILPERQGVWDTKQVLSSFRLDEAGRLVVGSVGALRGPGAGIHRAWAKRALKNVFPQLGDIPFSAEWYGIIGMTDNNLPKYHRLAQNVVSFSGYNGRGIAPGTVFGQALAQHILGNVPEDQLPLPQSTPKAAPYRVAKEASIELGAQLVHFVEGRF